ncbi:hypothetical protein AALO_G00049150 [Alosa alosa]|uniref:Uncharacterized protein n=1 Tax=Alosa alosa TaxID=278164 RepID=A0AAV6H445_9TELE|nr:hypothetical protein AALO_G00049150 [Alosa alosa]
MWRHHTPILSPVTGQAAGTPFLTSQKRLRQWEPAISLRTWPRWTSNPQRQTLPRLLLQRQRHQEARGHRGAADLPKSGAERSRAEEE